MLKIDFSIQIIKKYYKNYFIKTPSPPTYNQARRTFTIKQGNQNKKFQFLFSQIFIFTLFFLFLRLLVNTFNLFNVYL